MCKLLAITAGVVMAELMFCFMFCIFEFWLSMGIIADIDGIDLLIAFVSETVFLVAIIYGCINVQLKDD